MPIVAWAPRMRIVFLNPVGAIGGAERVLLDLVTSLRTAAPRADVHLIVGSEGPLIDAAREQGATVTLLTIPSAIGGIGDYGLASGQKGARRSFILRAPLAAWSAWRYSRQLRQLISTLQPAVVHSNGIKCHFLTRLARLKGTVVVWHIHDFVGSRPLMARGLRWASRAASGVIAISNAVGKDAQQLLPSVTVAVVPNAVDTDRFSPGPGNVDHVDRLANLRPAKSTVVRIGLVATFALWKGHEVFLEAARRLATERLASEVRFYVVGGPIYQTRGSQWTEEELRSKAADLLVGGTLGFLGFQKDIHEVYRALDIVVHASTRPEPFGLTIAEAMACGRAVIVTQGGGASELFTPNHDAVGVPPDNPDALVRAMVDLVQNSAKRQKLGHQAHVSALERFRRDRLGQQVLDAYVRFGAPPFDGP